MVDFKGNQSERSTIFEAPVGMGLIRSSYWQLEEIMQEYVVTVGLASKDGNSVINYVENIKPYIYILD
ncbi:MULTISPECIES: hypothetical protein [Nitrosomonas]|uniref:Uncharacterized protein n=1 Tax=Nitrosomonas communis TaxID=44574 RepID=A0A0F7KG44_9PROT|nr:MULTISPECIES: hypothetical protein [Nitrosomonas]AKH38153.1 hypothetical protein AAW31_10615 [Nitrosomonas communis]TYP74425.1 hypothetical protein BCL69_10894 [Nitrosomonas communis]UVS63504.1 hypothetical protein NX761_11215 [Nitrosomonas sp. PLL12]